MELTTQALQLLLQATVNTAEHELTCQECGDLVLRYIDYRVTGTGEMPADLRCVEQHLSVCPDCMEVVETIIAALCAERTGEGQTTPAKS